MMTTGKTERICTKRAMSKTMSYFPDEFSKM